MRLGFQEWMKRVNEILENNLAMGCEDLADAPYYDYWLSGYSALDAAEEVARDVLGSAAPKLKEDV